MHALTLNSAMCAAYLLFPSSRTGSKARAVRALADRIDQGTALKLCPAWSTGLRIVAWLDDNRARCMNRQDGSPDADHTGLLKWYDEAVHGSALDTVTEVTALFSDLVRRAVHDGLEVAAAAVEAFPEESSIQPPPTPPPGPGGRPGRGAGGGAGGGSDKASRKAKAKVKTGKGWCRKERRPVVNRPTTRSQAGSSSIGADRYDPE